MQKIEDPIFDNIMDPNAEFLEKHFISSSLDVECLSLHVDAEEDKEWEWEAILIWTNEHYNCSRLFFVYNCSTSFQKKRKYELRHFGIQRDFVISVFIRYSNCLTKNLSSLDIFNRLHEGS